MPREELQAQHATSTGRNADRAAAVAAVGDAHHAAGMARPGAAAGAAGAVVRTSRGSGSARRRRATSLVGLQAEFGAGAAAERNQAGAAVALDDLGVDAPVDLAVQHRAHGTRQAKRGGARSFSSVGTPRNGRSRSRLRQALFGRQRRQRIVLRARQLQAEFGAHATGRAIDGLLPPPVPVPVPWRPAPSWLPGRCRRPAPSRRRKRNLNSVSHGHACDAPGIDGGIPRRMNRQSGRVTNGPRRA